jgi:hypothetical protein
VFWRFGGKKNKKPINKAKEGTAITACAFFLQAFSIRTISVTFAP